MPKNTPTSFENAALAYLEKFSVSKKQLLDFLNRRKFRLEMKETPIEFNPKEIFPEIIEKMEELGYVNDERLAERTVELLRGQGCSFNFIMQKLAQKGLSRNIEGTEEDEEKAIKRFYEKKKLKDLPKEKALAKLARAGFSYETIRKINF